MSVAVVADAHLGGPGGNAGPLLEQLRALPEQGCEHLLLLGDLFHVWVGDPRYETPEIRELLPGLRELREQGVRLSYVEGNRDFFLGSGPYAELFDELGTEVAFEAAGLRYLAVHGDGLNERDWWYRSWRAVSKSLPSRLLFRRLPGALARRIVHSTEARLARTNFKHKSKIPESVILDYARERLTEGHDVLLLGHFHEPRRWCMAEGEVRIVDAWFHTREIEWLTGPDREMA